MEAPIFINQIFIIKLIQDKQKTPPNYHEIVKIIFICFI